MNPALAIVLLLPGWVYLFGAAWAVARFARRKLPISTEQPAISILKPLHGAEPGLYENLRSFAEQDYPVRQIVLGVTDPQDGAIEVAQALVHEFLGDDVALVIERRIRGSNGKVSNLENMLPAARHDILVLADSDMRVDRDYLAAVTAPLNDPRTGIVTCLYKAVSTGGIWSELGAMHINFGFFPGAVVGEALGVGRGCFGATIALRRQTLEHIGGFARVRDELADDHRLGDAVRSAGLAVVLSRYVVEARVAEPSFVALWRHELRWARTVRGVAPAAYAGSIVTHPLMVALFAAAVTGFGLTSFTFVAITYLVRWTCATMAARALGLRSARPALLPVRDALSFAVFVASFFARTVFWRDQHFRVASSGRMTADGDKV
jgi:ceramide glucosyltransferase